MMLLLMLMLLLLLLLLVVVVVEGFVPRIVVVAVGPRAVADPFETLRQHLRRTASGRPHSGGSHSGGCHTVLYGHGRQILIDGRRRVAVTTSTVRMRSEL